MANPQLLATIILNPSRLLLTVSVLLTLTLSFRVIEGDGDGTCSVHTERGREEVTFKWIGPWPTRSGDKNSSLEITSLRCDGDHIGTHVANRAIRVWVPKAASVADKAKRGDTRSTSGMCRRGVEIMAVKMGDITMVAASTASSSTSEESDPTLAHRVLCVHGHAQSPEGFRQKTGGIRRQCKRLVHFDFIQGPFEVPPDDVFAKHDPDSEKIYTWVDPAKESPENLGEFYVESIAKAMTPETQGLFGFSIGCPAILLAMARYPKAFENVKFIIFCGAFFPQNNSEQEAEIRACPLWPKVRAMIICGKSDQVVAEDRSLRVAKMFTDPVIFEHPKGHMVPAEARKDVKAFVQSALSEFSHDSDDEDLLTWRQPGIPRGQDKMDVSPIIEGITPDTKGVFAFSLGCAAALVAMAEHPDAFANVKFLICASGNLPQNPTLVEEIEKSPLVKTIPVMLIYGKKDQVVPEERFNTFKGVFPDPLIFYHDGGHVVPGSSRQQVREFMEKYI
ncbi:ovarian cancer-associated protein 2 protein [Perkinsus olseni]|uniref:Ovarian cancer-associated protein 2 protein n=1 Tax=Perkinsus olseni TaxID=32597 RepID=A0A7J6UC94_PEROL|nr:ovarian cancer-associated protein 2 protein [Perkinsus olseni]